MLKEEIEAAIRAQDKESSALSGMPREALADLPIERNFATVVTGEYGDKFDPKDDVLKGASSLSISNKEKENPRTLWAQDTADLQPRQILQKKALMLLFTRKTNGKIWAMTGLIFLTEKVYLPQEWKSVRP